MAKLKVKTQYNLGGTLGSVAGAALGQALIPIPGVGAAIGRTVGSALGTGIQNKIKPQLQTTFNPQGTTYAVGGPINAPQSNNELIQYEGNKHEQGGIPLGQTNNEVEGGETRKEDYIYSDRLKADKNKTFAQASKAIENKYKKRPNDEWANEAKAKDLDDLRQKQEMVRQTMVSKAIKKAYGGTVNKMWDGGTTDVVDAISPITETPTLYSNIVGIGDNVMPGVRTDALGFSTTPKSIDTPRLSTNTTHVLPTTQNTNANDGGTGIDLSQIGAGGTGLSNVGQTALTQMGNLYDIKRGIEGGDPVNIGRLQSVKSEQYDPTRAIQLQQEAGMGANELYRQQGGQGLGTYLSNIGAQTGRTQGAIATTQNTYDIANVDIRNADALNRQTTQQTNIGLAQTEADLRQQEKDIARNTLQSGLAGLSEGIAVNQLDTKLNTMQDNLLKNGWVASNDYATVGTGVNSKPAYKYTKDGVTKYFLVGTNTEVDAEGNPVTTT